MIYKDEDRWYTEMIKETQPVDKSGLYCNRAMDRIHFKQMDRILL